MGVCGGSQPKLGNGVSVSLISPKRWNTEQQGKESKVMGGFCQQK